MYVYMYVCACVCVGRRRGSVRSPRVCLRTYWLLLYKVEGDRSVRASLVEKDILLRLEKRAKKRIIQLGGLTSTCLLFPSCVEMRANKIEQDETLDPVEHPEHGARRENGGN